MTELRSSRLVPWGLALALALAVLAVAVKLTLTAGDLLPGLDGAYYWVQVRALLERGHLAFSDLPLLFWLQAGLAWVVRQVSGQPLDLVIPLVVRLTDAVLPSLAVLPLLLLAWRRKRPWLAPLLTLVLLFHPVQLYFFTGDFLKNEAALPLAVALGVLLVAGPYRRPWLALTGAALLLAGVALTHFGVFLLCAAVLLVWAVLQGWGWPWKLRLAALALLGVAVVLTAGLLAWWAPSRLERLGAAVTDLGSLFRNSVWELSGYQPDLIRAPLLFATVTGQVGALTLAGLALWRRRDLTRVTGPALVSLLVVAFSFSSPLLGIEWFDRLAALSFVPLVLAAGLVMTTVTSKTARVTAGSLAGLLAAATLTVTLLAAPQGATPPALTVAAWQDLQKVSREVKLPAESLVVARHGVEFLAAWLWRTDVVQDRYAGPEASAGYHATYLLLDKADEAKGRAGPSGGDKPDKGPPPPPGDNAFGKANPPAGRVEVLYDSASFLLLKTMAP